MHDMRPEHCPVHFALKAFNDAWTLLILRNLMFATWTSRAELEGIAEELQGRALSTRLAALKREGIIGDELKGSTDRYHLTRKGNALLSILVWVDQHGEAWFGSNESKPRSKSRARTKTKLRPQR